MKKIVAVALVLALAGCANQKLEDFKQWQQSAKSQAAAGNMKWSDYYSQAYDRVSGMSEIQGSNSVRRTYAELIPIARKYEAGQISKAEFEDAQRMAAVTTQERLDRDKAEAQRQQAIANQNTANALLMMQAAQPKPVQQTTTSCSSYKLGNTVQTDCR